MKKYSALILACLLGVSVYLNLFFLLNWQDKPPEATPAGTYQTGFFDNMEYLILQKDGQYSRYRPLAETALGRGTWEAAGDGVCLLTETTGECREVLLLGEDLYLPEGGAFLHFRKNGDIPLYNNAPEDAILYR